MLCMRIHCESNDKTKERSSAYVRFRLNLAHSIRKKDIRFILKAFSLSFTFSTVFVISF